MRAATVFSGWSSGATGTFGWLFASDRRASRGLLMVFVETDMHGTVRGPAGRATADLSPEYAVGHIEQDAEMPTRRWASS